MPPSKLVARLFWRFLVCYGVLIVPWPGLRVDHAFAWTLRTGGNLFLGRPGPLVQARFESLPPRPGGVNDTVARLFDRTGRPITEVRFQSRHLGYLPLATLAALVLATPLPWPRRRRALCLAAPLVAGFILLRLACILLEGAMSGGVLFAGRAYLQATIRRLILMIAVPSMWFFVPLLIWSLAIFRREDFVSPQNEARPPADSPAQV